MEDLSGTIVTSGERGLGKSVLTVCHDNDDDDKKRVLDIGDKVYVDLD